MTNFSDEFDLTGDNSNSELEFLPGDGGDNEHELIFNNLDEENDESDEIYAEEKPIANQIINDISSENVIISKSKVVLIEKLLQNIRENNDKIIQLLGGSVTVEDEKRIAIGQLSDETFDREKLEDTESGRIIEGVFDGESMIGPDGKQYSMPANYASKSKLVEGDIMKLTITDNGTFVYKQIGPIERRRVVGIVVQSESGNYYVVDEGGHQWRVLTASITYYKGQVGDEAVILVPKNGESKWAAVDNVVRKGE